MIAIPKKPRPSNWQDKFVLMLPAIQRQAAQRLRCVSRTDREDLLAEAVGLALAMFLRLAERGRLELAFATPLADYGCRQALDGRRLAGSLNVRDVSSRWCRRRKGVQVEHPSQRDDETGAWHEAVVDDRCTPVPDQAAFRCDFPAWLASLQDRDRKLAELLATGERTSEAARQYGVSAGRVSQLRLELQASWQQFHGEPVLASRHSECVVSC